jgi:FAD/FMN-containing dehydrogenase
LIGAQAATYTPLGANSVEKLRVRLHGELLLPEDAGYETARRVWNGMIDRHPALIVRCADQDDVVRAVEFARRHDLTAAVRGGGHSAAGWGVCNDGLVIDLSPMKCIEVFPGESRVRAEAGLTVGELIGATERHGLVTPVGVASTTGIAGLSLGGGMGLLTGKLGLTCDNVLAFEVVTADGRVLRASAQENDDLYWGLRGGGGNLGIVTGFEYQLHIMDPPLAGLIAYPLSHARQVLRSFRDFVAHGIDELAAHAGVLTLPDGYPVVGIVLCYCGDPAKGERIIRPLRQFGAPLMDTIRPMSYLDTISMFDATVPEGRKYYTKQAVVNELSDAVIDTIVVNAVRTTPFSSITLEHLHGAAVRVPTSAAAFPIREECFLVLHTAAWEDGTGDRHIAWANQAAAALQPFARPEAYVNFLSDEGEARVRAAYGANHKRLVALKNKYDPTNFLHFNHNIRPTTSAAAYQCQLSARSA